MNMDPQAQRQRAHAKATQERAQAIEDKITAIMEWSGDHPEFETEFVDSLNEQFLSRGDLSASQIKALDSIIEKWRIE